MFKACTSPTHAYKRSTNGISFYTHVEEKLNSQMVRAV
jgi:hypothetical protein